jgi:hypothetical protein
MLATGVALAKLPPPSAEDQAKAADKKAADDAQLEKEKVLLERAQDRVAERYRKEKGGPGPSVAAGKTSTENMPKTLKEGPRGVGPRPGMPQSAEAHSAPAK